MKLVRLIKMCLLSHLYASPFSVPTKQSYHSSCITYAHTTTPCSRVLLEKLIGLQSRNSPHFMEPKVSIIFLQGSATCPYPQPDESSPHFLNINIHIIIASKPRFSHWSLFFRIPTHNAACSCAPYVCDKFQLSYPAWFSYPSNWYKVLITKILIRQLSLAYMSSPMFFYQLYSRNSILHETVVNHSRSSTEFWVSDWGIKGQFKCTFYSLMLTHQKI